MKKPAFFYSETHKLAADLFLPNSDQFPGRRPGVVVCHGFGGIKEGGTAQPVAEVLAGEGYVALTFDYRGFGQSEGPRWRLLPMEQVEDIRNAMTFLEIQEEVDPARIGLYGTSFGGANVVFAAGIDDRARCVVSTVGYGDGERKYRAMRPYWQWRQFLLRLEEDRHRRVLTGESVYVHPDEVLPRDPEAKEWRDQMEERHPERKFQVPLETAEAAIRFKPEAVVHKIAPRALLLIRAGQDMLVPPEEAAMLFEKAGDPKRLVTVPGAGHHGVYAGEAFKTVMRETTAWFKRYLAGE